MINSEFKQQEGPGILEHPISIYTMSVASKQHPYRNEDAMLIMRKEGIFGVFDGVGNGIAAGEKASKIARDTAGKSFQALSTELTLQQAQEAMNRALIDANQAVYDQRRAEGNNMRTTASIGLIWNGLSGERKAIVGNIGNSRVYLLRKKRLEQVTLDDNRVRLSFPNEYEALQLQAKFNNVVDPERELTGAELYLFHSRNETYEALGSIISIKPRIKTIDLLPDDKLLACSDGISDNLTDIEIQALLNSNPDANTAVQKLIEAAQTGSKNRHARAKLDDMTALIYDSSIK